MYKEITLQDLKSIAQTLPPHPLPLTSLINSKHLLSNSTWLKMQNDYILYMSCLNK
jgi:hypothetical protein